MIRVAIYARYSSNLQSEASIEDQVRLCRLRLEKEGWHLGEIYSDHAISGATTLRPGYQKMLEDARNNGFDVLVAEALDRLSRDQEDIAGLYKQLSFAGVRLITLSEGEINELHVGLKGTMNALFLKDLAIKIKRGQRGRIESGFFAGGLSYGYEVVREVDANGNPMRGKRRISPEQSQIVLRIYTEYAQGKSPRKIAADLNREGIPSPRGGEWNASTINGHRGRCNGILRNELYIGQLVYNRVRMIKNPATGKRISRINPREEWVTVEVPHLRIIPDELWDRVQTIKKGHGNRPAHKSRRAKRLLSGLLSCGECGGAYTIIRPGKYGCAAHREKGTCSNARQITINEIETRVLAGVKEHLLDQELLADFVDEFQRELLRLQNASTQEHMRVEKDHVQLSQQIERIVSAIANGTDTPAMRDVLCELENKKAGIKDQLRQFEKPKTINRPESLRDVYRSKVERLQENLNVDDDVRMEATAILRSMIDRIVLQPGPKRGQVMVEVFGKPEGLIHIEDRKPGTADSWMIKVVAEEGLEPPTRGL